MKPFVYVAAPLTKPEPMENTNRAIRIGTELLLSNTVVPIVPHLTCFWHLITPMPYQVWCDYDLEILARCDALLRLPGESSGADAEEVRARELGMPCFTNTHDVLVWAYERANGGPT